MWRREGGTSTRAWSRWAATCPRDAGVDLAIADRVDVRTARVLVHTFDPEGPSNTGVLAFDLASRRTFDALLDRIPLRGTLESDARFGPWAGKTLSVPFGPTLDYVLTDRVALVGVGEGMLSRAIGRGEGTHPAAVLVVDLVPAGLSGEAWQFLFGRMRLRDPARAAERLHRWRELHVTLILEGTRLVFELAGGRR